MRRQVADQAGQFFWREAHQAASPNASREARLIHHRFFASVGFRAVFGEPIHVKCDLVVRSSEMHNAMVASSREVATLVRSCLDLLPLWDAFAYCSFWFLARLPASKKPGSDESTRSPRMNPIRKEGVG
jgi:hypothetical protein